ncbi:hypothetical protein PP7435_CHR2-0525 [Komagataella phaffii CBS 7435]|uniref:DUF833-domain-containing protein n=2 Tax=Komagataella phaffii TaxID=460519 RepID=C4R1M7_KOMPG|nr:uncharacterized protein PAS_chr2-1_0750 [Komagataella phaffii GS115]AOA62656.1 GQ67_00817T0 [Komagataella phaffii]CAH2448067.1 hypothetical protein BQ9382_C2-2875 [Komagataella phaffii CBS 7435]AOA68076.1 GQ68_00572T0 [Komagataella phaffii GS115]CAY69401.1 Putative protein of unknown function [Komagataella phaffii GS115]CCA38212.1 hypothetical protein PP7435_CHR2-0525 [Komagataella phaffii CBS 7435]
MCILLTCANTKEYSLVLASNRDEYFKRPTHEAEMRLVDGVETISPYDLAREERGTWIGITTTGRLAVLVNYRDPIEVNHRGKVSRGLLPISYLTCAKPNKAGKEEASKKVRPSTKVSYGECSHGVQDWPDDFIQKELKSIGGFSLMYGQLSMGDDGRICPLSVFTNRSTKRTKVFVDADQFGLSNSHFFEPWPKVIEGQQELSNLMKAYDASEFSLGENMSRDHARHETLIDEIFKILSIDRIHPNLRTDYISAFEHFPESIFIPPIETPYYHDPNNIDNPVAGDYYGTRTQTIILVDRKGNVEYIEKTLHSRDQEEIEKNPIRRFNFRIDGFVRCHSSCTVSSGSE